MEDRLSRVEKKIDTLQEAIVSLARVEERLTTVFNRQSSIESKVNAMDKHLSEMSAKTDNRFSERIFWILIIGIVTTLTSLLG
jgi:vacuolar-type H+-ATPase subunit E/Vma4|tara:strand:+ start:1399 stop:1647 length:249 start_codon:yes stop_codon:yes gene_type:complete